MNYEKSFNKDLDYNHLKQSASHYKGETNYCSVIAFAITMGCQFGKARGIFKREINRKDGKGTYQFVVHPLYEKFGKTLTLISTRGFMIANAASRLPRIGTFLIYSSGHVTCLRDGVIHDWCSDPRARGKRMKQVFKVT